MDLLDHLIGEVTKTMPKQTLFDLLISHKIPSAPVRELDEVINDKHLHETGMLSWVDHPDFGRVLAHNSPIKFENHDSPPYQASRKLGEDTTTILKELFELPDTLVSRLDQFKTKN
jgi:formyl-CoA transferase